MITVGPHLAIAAFIATAGLFLLPTYPTTLAAISFDDTGSTRTGKFIFDHSFQIPGIVTIFSGVLFAYLLGFVVL